MPTDDIESLYRHAIKRMERAFHELASHVPQPAPVNLVGDNGWWYRYAEQTIYQAIVLKLARFVSALNASCVLLEHGFLQEQGALSRMVDEAQEDVMFLNYAIVNGELTEVHKAYLTELFKEPYANPSDPIGTRAKYAAPSRRKIHAYIARQHGANLDPSTGLEVAQTIMTTYSGYVHGAASHIIEMYGGSPPHFHLHGMVGTPYWHDHRADLWNYVYRGLCAFVMSAHVFKNTDLYKELDAYRKAFEQTDAGSNSE